MHSAAFMLATITLTSVLVGCGSKADTATTSGSNESASQSASASVTPTSVVSSAGQDSSASFVDGVLDTPDITIKITDVRKIAPGQPGNSYGSQPVIAFWYDITNKSGKSSSPMDWIFSFDAYQDNDPNFVKELKVASSPDSALVGTQSADIKQGGTLQGAVAYTLDDEVTPVELVASKGFGTTEIGRQQYPIPE
ncbi:MAG: DUF5067 domain-containing protein [Corynebacterium flavescens]|nr:DUF5067 domain-containing protein [Corynebacterium flavescens]